MVSYSLRANVRGRRSGRRQYKFRCHRPLYRSGTHVTVVILLVSNLVPVKTRHAAGQREEVLVVEEKLGMLESEVDIHLHGPRRHRLAVDRALTIREKRLELDLRDVEVGGRTAILDHFETLRDEVGEPLKLEAEVGEPTLDDELESPLEELGVVGVTPFLAQLPFDLRDLPVDLVAIRQ